MKWHPLEFFKFLFAFFVLKLSLNVSMFALVSYLCVALQMKSLSVWCPYSIKGKAKQKLSECRCKCEKIEVNHEKIN